MDVLNPLGAYFQTLARYHLWATRRLLAEHIAPLPEADYRRDCGLFFKSIHGTLNHLLVGEGLLWQRRFIDGVSPSGIALDAEAEPERARLAQRLLDVAQAWQPFITSLSPERFASTLAYATSRGEPVTSPFALTLAHVFNHATHHRGQITAALTAMGRAAPVLDLIYMLREEAA
ncbi:MAG: DinB family protein [Thiomonas sp.]